MATVLCVLYDDPVDGYPPAYARDEIPAIERYPDGQTTPTPEGIDFTPVPVGVVQADVECPHSAESLVEVCDVVTINAPLHPRPSISSTTS